MLKNSVMKERWREEVAKQERGMEGNKVWKESGREGGRKKGKEESKERNRMTEGRKEIVS